MAGLFEGLRVDTYVGVKRGSGSYGCTARGDKEHDGVVYVA